MPKRLYRSKTSSMMGGVCGGLGEYFDVDPTVVRVIAVILGLASMGWAVVAYIIGWVIIPDELPGTVKSEQPRESTPQTGEGQSSSTWTRYFPGLALIFFGSLILVRENWYWFAWDEFWPLLLIGIGLALIFWRSNSAHTVHSVKPEVETNDNDIQNESTAS